MWSQTATQRKPSVRCTMTRTPRGFVPGTAVPVPASTINTTAVQYIYSVQDAGGSVVAVEQYYVRSIRNTCEFCYVPGIRDTYLMLYSYDIMLYHTYVVYDTVSYHMTILWRY